MSKLVIKFQGNGRFQQEFESFSYFTEKSQKWFLRNNPWCGHCKQFLKETVPYCNCAELSLIYFHEKYFREYCDVSYYEEKRRRNKMVAEAYKDKKNRADGIFTLADRRELIGLQKCLCYYCAKKLTNEFGAIVCHVDHITPLSKGGSNWISNRALACPECNSLKSYRTGAEFFKLVKTRHGEKIAAERRAAAKSQRPLKEKLSAERQKQVNQSLLAQGNFPAIVNFAKNYSRYKFPDINCPMKKAFIQACAGIADEFLKIQFGKNKINAEGRFFFYLFLIFTMHHMISYATQGDVTTYFKARIYIEDILYEFFSTEYFESWRKKFYRGKSEEIIFTLINEKKIRIDAFSQQLCEFINNPTEKNKKQFFDTASKLKITAQKNIHRLAETGQGT